jgi:hypothetical protein
MLYTLQGFRLFFARHPTPTTKDMKNLVNTLSIEEQTKFYAQQALEALAKMPEHETAEALNAINNGYKETINA